MAVTVREICDNVTLAREMTMLGNYESAEVYYEGSIQMISRLILMIPEPLRKNKWQQVQKKVASEYDEIKVLKTMLQTLRIDTNVEVPIGVRRLRDEPVRDYGEILSADPFLSSQNDPDVWPAPTPVDHGYNQRYFVKNISNNNFNQKSTEITTQNHAYLA